MKQYDLVKVISFNDEKMIGAIGIIESKVHGGLNKLIFVGQKHNELSRASGHYLFTNEELEGI